MPEREDPFADLTQYEVKAGASDNSEDPFADLAEYEVGGQSSAPNVSAIESFLRGVGQGASLGFGDEIVGGVKGAYSALTSDESLGDAYRRERDELRAGDRAAREANPGAFLGGEAGGSLASLAVPGLGAARAVKGASLATKLGRAALAGAKAGGVTGLGTSEADLTEGELGEAARDVGAGAATGAAFGAGGAAAGQVASKIGQKLGRTAERSAARGVGLRPKDYRRLGSEKEVRNVGRTLLDEKLLGRNASKALQKAQALRRETGQALGQLRRDTEGTVSLEDVEKALRARIRPPAEGVSDARTYQDALESALQDAKAFARSGRTAIVNGKLVPEKRLSAVDLADLKKQLSKPFERADQAPRGSVLNTETKALGDQARKVVRGFEDTVQGEGSNDLGRLARRYMNLRNVEDALTGESYERLGRKAANPLRLPGLAETGVAQFGGKEGLAVVALNRVRQLFEQNGMPARTADRLSKILSSSKYGPILARAAERGGTYLTVALRALQQTPGYQELEAQVSAEN